jgi:3-hydroxyacyl-[acyl-carrier-protein] dehydratase
MEGRAEAAAGGAELDRLIGLLQQKPPALLVDRILHLEPLRRVEGAVTFPAGHRVFEGHLPGEPLVPGVIIVEALAQLAGIALMKDGGELIGGYLAEVGRTRFYRPVRPGEEVRLAAELAQAFGIYARFEVVATVAGERAVSGSLTLARKRS